MAGQACSHDTPHKLPATELPGTSWPAIGDQAGFEPFSGETTRAALTPPDWITITHSRSVDHDVARQAKQGHVPEPGPAEAEDNEERAENDERAVHGRECTLQVKRNCA